MPQMHCPLDCSDDIQLYDIYLVRLPNVKFTCFIIPPTNFRFHPCVESAVCGKHRSGEDQGICKQEIKHLQQRRTGSLHPGNVFFQHRVMIIIIGVNHHQIMISVR